MKGILACIALSIVIQACSTTGSAAVAVMPAAPAAPKIEHPEKLEPADKRALADFYRTYAIYKEKLEAWKKRFK